jgi:hypothetical protein
MAALRAACAQIRGYRVPGPCPGPECRFIDGIHPQGTPGNSAKRRESSDGETARATFNHPPWGFRIRPKLCQGVASTTTGHVSLPHASRTAAGGGSTAKRTALTPSPLGFQQAVDEPTSATCNEPTSASSPEPNPPASYTGPGLGQDSGLGSATCDTSIPSAPLDNAPSPDFTALGDVLDESFWDDATNNMAVLHPAPTDIADTVGEMPGGEDEVPDFPSQFDWLH